MNMFAGLKGRGLAQLMGLRRRLHSANEEHRARAIAQWRQDYADRETELQADALEYQVICLAAPVGWQCTRMAGHAGPCAAVDIRSE